MHIKIDIIFTTSTSYYGNILPSSNSLRISITSSSSTIALSTKTPIVDLNISYDA